MIKSATAEAQFLEDFAAHAADLPGAGVPWLDARRADAIKTFRAQGLPHRRIEEWKYSDLRAALNDGASTIATRIAHAEPFAEIPGPVFSMVRGALEGGVPAGLPDGVEALDVRDVGEDAPAWVKKNFGMSTIRSVVSMDAASLALMRGGFVLRVSGEIAQPIHLRFALGGQCRVLVVLEANASATILETHAGNDVLENIGAEFVLGVNARLTHMRVAANAPGAVQVEEISIEAMRGAVYRGHFVNLGAKLSRVELRIGLEGEGAEAHLSGASVLGDEAHADLTTHITHAVGKTTSTQLFKKVAGGKSRAVYQGKITVCEGADGSDSRQIAKALLLGARAEADLKPELEIFADDVKCAHGAAVGDLDVESLFYLRSRGIAEAEARNLLIRAFLEDAMMPIADDVIRAAAWNTVEAALPRAMEILS
jgi:Fe-S cluster assembly protein SufD